MSDELQFGHLEGNSALTLHPTHFKRVTKMVVGARIILVSGLSFDKRNAGSYDLISPVVKV